MGELQPQPWQQLERDARSFASYIANQFPQSDPRGMQQRYLSFALFDNGGMLSRSLEGVDREALYKAVRAGLKNQDGRARGSIGSVYRNLSAEDIKPLLPAIYQAIIEPAPSGEMTL